MGHQKQRFEAQLRKLSLIGSVPLYLLLLWTLIYAEVSIWLVILFGFLGAILVLMVAYLIHQRAEYQFRSLTNLLEALTQGEYSMRAVSSQTGGALDELVDTINGLAERLSKQRWEADENQLLVNTVIDHIDVAIIALTEKNEISFLNPAAEKLLLLDSKDSKQKLIQQLDFIQDFASGYNQVIELSFGQQQGRFNVHIEEFRKTGEQHKLLFISNVTSLLRSEERKAWQSLVRVISHEINNSLSPIASISQTLSRLMKKETNPSKNQEDLLEGLTIIGERAKSLSHFVDSYKQLAKLPEPQKSLTSIKGLVEKACALFTDHTIEISPIRDIEVLIDPVQLEQVLINLIKNAIEATSGLPMPRTQIKVDWLTDNMFLRLMVHDKGPGIANESNLFVPFYSTKKEGSGIGLVLCRQIIENHQGQLTIQNSVTKANGCTAVIKLPLVNNIN